MCPPQKESVSLYLSKCIYVHSTVSSPAAGQTINGRSYDLHTLRLCFQLLYIDERTGQTVALPPVLSDTLYDKKANIDLIMFDVSDTSGSTDGGKKLIVLCDKVIKEDIAVRFFERDPAAPAPAAGQRLDDDATMVWSARADLQSSGVHRQVAIVLRTPAYSGRSGGRARTEPVEVYMQLFRPSDGACSAPQTFVYTPAVRERSHPESATKRKRRKVQHSRELHEYVAAISESELDDDPDELSGVVAISKTPPPALLMPSSFASSLPSLPPLPNDMNVDTRIDDILVDLFEPPVAGAVCEATNDLNYMPPVVGGQQQQQRQSRSAPRMMQPNINVANLNVMVGNGATLQAVAVQAQQCQFAAPVNEVMVEQQTQNLPQQQQFVADRGAQQQQQPMQAMVHQPQQQHQRLQPQQQHQQFHQQAQMRQPQQQMFNNVKWPSMNPQYVQQPQAAAAVAAVYPTHQQVQQQHQQQLQPQQHNVNNCIHPTGASDFLNYMEMMTPQQLHQQQPTSHQQQQQHQQPTNPFHQLPMRGYYAQEPITQQPQPQFHQQNVHQQQYAYQPVTDQQHHHQGGFQQQFQHQQQQHQQQPFKASAPMSSANFGQSQMHYELNHAMAYVRQH